MDKQSFFEEIKEFKTAKLFLTGEVSEIRTEIDHNWIQIGVSDTFVRNVYREAIGRDIA